MKHHLTYPWCLNSVLISSGTLHSSVILCTKFVTQCQNMMLSQLITWHQNPKVHHGIHQSPPPVPILSQTNPLHTPPPPCLPKIHSDTIYALVFQLVSFLRAFLPKLCTIFSPLPCVPHAPPVLFSLIWSAWRYFELCTKYEAPQCASFHSPVTFSPLRPHTVSPRFNRPPFSGSHV
jgi:hypothetical protein